ncbi:hypothetical protein [uncultured Martelella sp.]|uniref:hypothetical protein n=1 Tax=uncultured Martelella sp. TaxID=392331 RepID=UPI0029C607D6|nr:hypothetical protein [uncultured Martelella sp.]
MARFLNGHCDWLDAVSFVKLRSVPVLFLAALMLFPVGALADDARVITAEGNAHEAEFRHPMREEDTAPASTVTLGWDSELTMVLDAGKPVVSARFRYDLEDYLYALPTLGPGAFQLWSLTGSVPDSAALPEAAPPVLPYAVKLIFRFRVPGQDAAIGLAQTVEAPGLPGAWASNQPQSPDWSDVFVWESGDAAGEPVPAATAEQIWNDGALQPDGVRIAGISWSAADLMAYLAENNMRNRSIATAEAVNRLLSGAARSFGYEVAAQLEDPAQFEEPAFRSAVPLELLRKFERLLSLPDSLKAGDPTAYDEARGDAAAIMALMEDDQASYEKSGPTRADLVADAVVEPAQNGIQPVDARATDNRSLAAIVTGIDQVVCSATVVGPRHVLTAAACVLDPETGEVIADRQVMPRIDLDDGYIPVSRRFIQRVYLPVDAAPFSTAGAPESQIALVEVREPSERPPFAAETDEISFYRGEEAGAGDGRPVVQFHDAATGGLMTASGCAALEIEPGDLMPVNCTLPDGASGAGIRAASGIFGVYLSPGLGRYLGKTEVEAIEAIVMGSGSPFFRAIEANPRFAITFVLTNRCDVPIDYNLRYRVMEGDDSGEFTDISGRIEGGARRFVDLMTDNGVVYMRGTARDGDLVWDGGRVFDSGRHFGIRIDSWGDYFHALSCDDK